MSPSAIDWPTLLAARTARCHCGRTMPSIAFVDSAKRGEGASGEPEWFEYRGPEVSPEDGCDECGMPESRHPSATGKIDHNYRQDERDEPFDLFYDGCDE